jgi:hypothetical protein
MSLFVMVLCFLFFGLFARMLRGCLFWLVGLYALAWLLRHDHEAARAFWDLFDTVTRKAGEFINEP